MYKELLVIAILYGRENPFPVLPPTELHFCRLNHIISLLLRELCYLLANSRAKTTRQGAHRVDLSRTFGLASLSALPTSCLNRCLLSTIWVLGGAAGACPTAAFSSLTTSSCARNFTIVHADLRVLEGRGLCTLFALVNWSDTCQSQQVRDQARLDTLVKRRVAAERARQVNFD